MTVQARWDDAKRLLHDALQLDAAAREAFIRDRCREAPDLYEEVRSLLSWAEDSTGFLETPLVRVANLALSLDQPDPLIGRSLGPWRVVGVIGRGGMGAVYRAERADGAFRRLAAVKVVGRGANASNILERFHRERETLAALDHPNIARLYDGGTTPEGAPYFVMEYVDGVRVDHYCDTQRLSIDERLTLFRTICAAVQYAHQSLVVHRDIKPDNILVARDGSPKLLDFGIARLLSEGSAQGDDASAAATWLLTPDYASPEQMSGGAVTTAADVYSLGVLLHVLLAGVPPYRFSAATQAALREEFAAATLSAPSGRVRDDTTAGETASARRTMPATLARRLAGDLDAVVMRALERDPRLRYQTADQLADDLERHATHHPVTARRRDIGYVAGRFLRRHAVGLGVAAAVLLLAGAGVAGVLWQAAIAADAQALAERRFNDVRRLARVFMFDVHDEIVNVPGTTNARALMVRTASEYLSELGREASGDLGLQRELASAFVKVGDAQGHPTSANIGDTAGARASYERAIEIATGVLRAAPDDVVSERTRAMAHRRLADVLAWSGDRGSALTQCQLSKALFLTVARRNDATPDDLLQAKVAFVKLGDLLGNPNLPNLGRADEASAEYAGALDGLRELHRRHPGHQQIRRYLGITLERIGTMAEASADWPSASAAYQESFEIRQALALESPFHADVQRDLAIAYEKLGNVQLSLDRAGAAVASYRGAIAQLERLEASDPSNAQAARSVAISRENLARVLVRSGGRPEAIEMLSSALAAHREIAGRDKSNAQARCDAARLGETLADTLAPAPSTPAAPLPESCALWRESLEVRRQLQPSGLECAAPTHVQRLTLRLANCP